MDDGLADWIDGSAFIDDGRPRVLYHGTDSDQPFNVFTRCEEASVGFHFGTVGAANARLEQTAFDDPDEICGTVVPVLCRASRPLRLEDHYTWGLRDVLGEMLDAGVIGEDAAEAVEDSCDEAWLYAALELAGHDCVVYRNATEDVEAGSDSVFVWRAELVKGLFADRFDVDDPRLLPQAPTDDEDMRDWERLSVRIDGAKAELRPMFAATQVAGVR